MPREHEFETENESLNLLEDYLGIEKKHLSILIAIMASVFVLVTGIYIALFGFQHWRTNMSRAGSMMVINFQVNGTNTVTRQYVCPSCGAVGLPQQGPNGEPLCPNCGQRMKVR